MSRRESLDWIDNLPAEWSAVQLKYLLVSGNDAMKVGPFGTQLSGNDFTDDGYWVYNQRTVVDQNFEDNNTFVSEEKYNAMKSFQVEAGDILITTRGTIGRICKVPEHFHRGIIHPCIIKFRIDENKILYDLVRVLFNESDMIKEQLVYMSNATTIDVVYSGPLKNVFIPVAPIKTQRSISAYLDAKCSEIDALTADIQSQIDTLEQYKRSVITEAVTKGLEKDVEMKESGSQYWGDIPVKWDIVDIKYLFEIVKRIAGHEGYDILSITQHGIKVRDTSKNEGQVAADYSNYQFLYPGEYAMNHMDLLTGWVDLSDKFGVTSPDYRVFRLRDTKRNSRRYYKYIMQICYMCKIFYSLGNGVSNLGRWRLQTSSFNNFKVPVPPYEEQEEISDYLDAKIREIEATIELKNEQLSTLDLFKKSLIYEYVTGKKEVPAV